MSGRNQPNKRGRPSTTTPPKPKKRLFVPRPMDDVRYNETAHWPIPIDINQRCKHCINAYTTMTCSKRNLHLYLTKKKCVLMLFIKNNNFIVTYETEKLYF